MNIAILYIGLNGYMKYYPLFKQTCLEYFLPNHNKHFFLFIDDAVDAACDETIIETVYHSWKITNLHRFKYFLTADLSNYDYCFFFNANQIFRDTVNDCDVIPKSEHSHLVSTSWDDYTKSPQQYIMFDRNPDSVTYLPDGKYYHNGSFQGGRTKEFLELCKQCSEWIDMNGEYIPTYNDEAYFNKYVANKNILRIGTDIANNHNDSKCKFYLRNKV